MRSTRTFARGLLVFVTALLACDAPPPQDLLTKHWPDQDHP